MDTDHMAREMLEERPKKAAASDNRSIYIEGNRALRKIEFSLSNPVLHRHNERSSAGHKRGPVRGETVKRNSERYTLAFVTTDPSYA